MGTNQSREWFYILLEKYYTLYKQVIIKKRQRIEEKKQLWKRHGSYEKILITLFCVK